MFLHGEPPFSISRRAPRSRADAVIVRAGTIIRLMHVNREGFGARGLLRARWGRTSGQRQSPRRQGGRRSLAHWMEQIEAMANEAAVTRAQA
jgi:hypothetical protein